MRRIFFWVTAIIAVIVLIGTLDNDRSSHRTAVSPSAPPSESALAPAGANTASELLLGPVTAERSGDGMKISGMIRKLPPGTKIWVDIIHVIHQPGGALKRGGGPAGPQDANVIVAADGTFHASLRNISWDGKNFVDNGPFRPGSYAIMISAYFNTGWQAIDVLRKAGVELNSQGRSSISTDPRAIPESPDFKPDDPEFPKAGRHLEAIREVKLGPLPADVAAIDAVKGAILGVQGRGRSSLPVGKSVDLFASLGAKPIAWSAAVGPDAKWIVSLDCVDGEKQQKAQWSYEPKSGAVRYLDPLAKTLSYTPRD